MRNIAWTFSLILSILSSITFAQSTEYNVYELSTEDNLVSNIVHDVLMDSTGFMWFATKEGISRYDGTTCKNYLNLAEKAYTKSIETFDLLEDRQSRLWVSSFKEGLMLYDKKSDQFIPFGAEKNIDMLRMIIDDNDVIWGGTFHKGFFQFDTKNKTFKFHNIHPSPNSKISFDKNSVWELIEDYTDPNILWIAAANAGLYQFNKTTEQLTHIPFPENKDINLGVMTLMMDQTDELWLGTWGQGLIKFTPSTQKWEYLNERRGTKASKPEIIRHIKRIGPNEIWLAGDIHGFYVYQPKINTFTPFNEYYNNLLNSSLSFLSYEDSKGRYWLLNVTDGAADGVSVLKKKKLLFQFEPIEDFLNCFSGSDKNKVYDIEIDEEKGLIYVNTRGCGGLYIYDFNFRLIKAIDLPIWKDSSSIIDQYYQMLLRKNGDLILAGGANQKGQKEKLLKLNTDDFTLKPAYPYLINRSSLNKEWITDIVEDEKEVIWLRDQNLNIWKIDGNKVESIAYPTTGLQKRVYPFSASLHNGIDNQLYIASGKNGVSILDIEKETFRSEPLIHKGDSIEVSTLVELGKGELIIGSVNHGLWQVNINESIALTPLPMQDEFPVSLLMIDKIMKDNKNNLWITSAKGLFYYSLDQQLLYSLNDELTEKNLVDNALKISSDNQIFLGQNNGFHHFEIEDVPAVELPPLAITTMKFFNVSSSQTLPISNEQVIDINYDDLPIGINFSALEYDLYKENLYAYKLESLTNEWIFLGDKNELFIPYLSPGMHILNIRNGNKDANWSEDIQTLSININPPWWQTNWAYFTYLIFALILTFGIYQFLLNRRLERTETKRIRDLDEFKTTLYTNITHEFRTPLTIIQGLVDQLLGHAKPYIKELEIIRRNTGQLLNLVNQLLDLRKIEVNKLQLKMQQGDVIPYIKSISNSFQALAKSKGVNIHFLTSVSNLNMDYDPDQLLNIISNLLSNAIKFTPDKGNVYFQIDKKENKLFFSVKDSGIGIPKDQLDKIFDRFVQVENSITRSKEGTGIGLALTKELVQMLGGNIRVESEIDKGSTFIVYLPITNHSDIVNDVESKQDKIIADRVFTYSSSYLSSIPSINNKGEEPIVGNKPHLLLVEDNSDLQTYLHSCLKDNYDVSIAVNGEEGYKMAIDTIPDIILSDVMMPVMDGFALCQQLKQDEKTNHIPIIFLTAKADIQSKIEGLQFGANAYIGKPFYKEELEITLHNLLETRAQLQKKYQSNEFLVMEFSEPDQVEDEFIIKIKDIIFENIDDPDFGIKELSKQVFMDRSTLHRKVKQLTGMAPGEYLHHTKLIYALQLIKTTDSTLTQIALECGYKELSYFSTLFKAKFKISPNKIRK